MQAHKLGVMLVHPSWVRTCGSMYTRPPPFLASMFSMGCCEVGFGDVRRERGAPAKGGGRMLKLSCARWCRERTAPPTPGSSCCSGDGCEKVPLQFWMRRGRLQPLIEGGWSAYLFSTDTWQASTERRTPLRDGHVVRAVDVV